MPRSPQELLQGVREPLRSIALQIIAESNGRIGITGMGGYRTREQQAQLRSQYLAGKGPLAAEPGHSEHERGMAVDFSGDKELLAQLAAKHGLIASVPGEDWHYTLGEGAQFDGDDFNFAYDPDGESDPQDVFANRMTSILSILGGASPVGTRPMGKFDEELSALEFPDNQPLPPGQQIARASASSAAAGSIAAYQAYAREQFKRFGWTSAEMNALIELWDRESDWNPNADNPTSTAQGIAQKLQSVHGPVESSPQAQMDWGLQYIKDRYGSPSRALAFHDRHNFY